MRFTMPSSTSSSCRLRPVAPAAAGAGVEDGGGCVALLSGATEPSTFTSDEVASVAEGSADIMNPFKA
jgi:hypothetical protein